jgi:hypothetical protein
MRILLNCPTRSRPEKILRTLRTYIQMADTVDQIGVAISCDTDDTSMARPVIHDQLHALLAPLAWHRIVTRPNTTKIQACNAAMDEIEWPWDIVVLVSDDMIPQIQGWDTTIRMFMRSYFPDTNGILWANDGFQGPKLNTLCIFGRAMYASFGYIYHPDYKSLFCDTELTDRCRGDLASRCHYIPYCLIRHEHPGTGFPQAMDALYAKNQTYWSVDLHTYIRRKTYAYDWSVLIPTIPGRDASLARLTTSIREKVARLCPALRIEWCIAFDAKETSIGLKRESLLQAAQGKYTSFIDDDDAITDAYIEDLWACIQGGYHTMRIRGQMADCPFVHSTEISLSSPMATMDEPPLFQRPPNHLNPMLADVAKWVHFKDARRGEDLDWTLSLVRLHALRTEYRSDPSRTHYLYTLRATTTNPDSVRLQRTLTYETMLGLAMGSVEAPPPVPSGGPRVLRLGSKGFVSR